MRIEAQADTFALRIADMGWRDGVHTSEANTPDGHRLMVRYPWEENPHYEWQHHHGEGRPVTGIASSLGEGKAAAEQSHKDLTGGWDPDAEQDALDPRLLGAALDWKQYQDSFTDQAGIKPDSDFLTAVHPSGGDPTADHHYWVNTEVGKPHAWEVEHHPPGVEPGGQIGDVYGGFPTREDAMDWADKRHPDEHGWSPESDPFDPRQFGAAARFARSYFAADDGLDEGLDPGEDKKKKQPNTGLEAGTPTGLNEGAMPALPAGSAAPTQHVNVGPMAGGGMPSPSGGSAPSSYTPGSGVQQWKQDVDLGLQREGLPTSLDNQVLHQMETESSGNPKAINNWDSNAQAGHPSQGLMQTIPSTFQQYHLPGDSMDITDPQANIDSAIGYAKERYGPTLMNNGGGMGSGHGY